MYEVHLITVLAFAGLDVEGLYYKLLVLSRVHTLCTLGIIMYEIFNSNFSI